MSRKYILLKLILLLHSFYLCAQFPRPVTDQTNGYVEIKSKTGVILEKGSLNNGLREGEWNYYTSDGKPRAKVNYLHDTLHGNYVTYYADGKIAVSGQYLHGKPAGEWKAWYEDGKQLRSHMHYEDTGRVIVSSKRWYATGELSEVYVRDSTNRYMRTRYFKDGRRAGLNQGIYIPTAMSADQEQPDGVQIDYLPNVIQLVDTLPFQIVNYKNGVLHGAKIKYTRGILTEECYYKNGVQDSIFRKWNHTGQLLYSIFYSNGKLNGKCTYFKDGAISREVLFVNGLKHGREIFHFPVEAVNWYTNDILDSSFVFYSNGQPSRKIITTALSPRTYSCSDYDSTGKLVKEWNPFALDHDGLLIQYYPNGQLRCTIEKKSGKPDGFARTWSKEGYLVLVLQCTPGQNTKVVSVMNNFGTLLSSTSMDYDSQIDNNLPTDFTRRRDLTMAANDWRIVVDPANAGADKKTAGQEDIAEFAETMPSFVGGEIAFQQYLRDTLHYPKAEREAGKSGTVYVKFCVEKDGSISNVTVVKEVPGAPGFTNEAIRVISEMPKWNPGLMNGRAIRVWVTQPVKFIYQ